MKPLEKQYGSLHKLPPYNEKVIKLLSKVKFDDASAYWAGPILGLCNIQLADANCHLLHKTFYFKVFFNK